MAHSITIQVDDEGHAQVIGTGDAQIDLVLLLSAAQHIVQVMQPAEKSPIVVPTAQVSLPSAQEALWQTRKAVTRKTG